MKHKPDWLLKLPDQDRYEPHRQAVRDALRHRISDHTSRLPEKARQQMVHRLADTGITDPFILNAFLSTPRHLFIDSALLSRSYENSALPIGHGQTISKPSVVAKMIALLRQRCPHPQRILEVGGGCGYQAAILAQFSAPVYSIERIAALCDKAQRNIDALAMHIKTEQITLIHGDGYLGLPQVAPFDWIIMAAAAQRTPPDLIDQLSPGGRLVAPMVLDKGQHLLVLDKSMDGKLSEYVADAVHFVPFLSGCV